MLVLRCVLIYCSFFFSPPLFGIFILGDFLFVSEKWMASYAGSPFPTNTNWPNFLRLFFLLPPLSLFPSGCFPNTDWGSFLVFFLPLETAFPFIILLDIASWDSGNSPHEIATWFFFSVCGRFSEASFFPLMKTYFLCPLPSSLNGNITFFLFTFPTLFFPPSFPSVMRSTNLALSFCRISFLPHLFFWLLFVSAGRQKNWFFSGKPPLFFIAVPAIFPHLPDKQLKSSSPPRICFGPLWWIKKVIFET